MSYTSRLSRAFQNAPIIPLTSRPICLFSDCHRGDGTSGDNFLKNRELYLAALQYYYARGFLYIELGDGDELWENRKLNRIIEIHDCIFRILSQFYHQGRLYLLYGNHDMEKRRPGYADRVCSNYFCTDTLCTETLFPKLTFHEGIILENPVSCERLYLTHGHQADFWNSTGWRVTRFLVRYLWRPLERFGVLDPTSAAKNYKRKERTEKRLVHYAERNRYPLITGHTHRPRLNSESPMYMNTGSCVHPHSITCMEIDASSVTLVKWEFSTKQNRTLYVSRDVLSCLKLPLHTQS